MRMLGKDSLTTAGDDAKVACGSDQLCAGLEAGVEGGLHSARAAWEGEGWIGDEAPAPDDPFFQVVNHLLSDNKIEDLEMDLDDVPSVEAEGMSLIDAANGFNLLKRYQMLWNVRHRWAKGSRIAFNSYRHFNQVIVRRGGGKTAHVILAEEGLSQGDPLAMALYGVALLPLAEKLKRAVPEVAVPWFADDVATVGNLSDCALALEFLCEVGPQYGYFPEPEKTHVICTEREEAEAQWAFLERDLVVTPSRGERYLGGFVGSKREKEEWVKKKVEVWEKGVNILAGIAKRFPQTAFAGVAMSLQHEWQYVARTVPGIGHLFAPVERAIRNNFLPTLLGEDSITGEMR